jgi:hypothetical protein
MSNSKECVIRFINDLYSRYNYLKIRYEYNEEKSKHIIEILGDSTSTENNIWEIKYDFSRSIKNEYAETILFIDQKSLTKISCADFEIGYDCLKVEIKNTFENFFKQINFASDFNNIAYKAGENNYALAA